MHKRGKFTSERLSRNKW